ncbi:hypothetical protein KUTeg_012671 [Tegillarca granosa]|uniref:TRPM-like domain-containing protein n=1 Tax=Tegillarca granosa TaxID=220873 RepID=A0ABQ9F070_TEGGR|nr:hypothetical protein KUTeg_012671 [Tegillarca granosa]
MYKINMNLWGYFLEHGIEPSRYVDNVNLWNLYANCLLSRHTDKTTDMLLKMLSPFQRSWYRVLTFKPMREFYSEHEDLVIYMGKVIEKLLKDRSLNPHRDVGHWRTRNQTCQMGYIPNTNDLVKKVDSETALQNLFVWSILTNRREMAFQFWKMLPRHNIAAALLASSLFRQMAKYAENIEDLDLSELISQNTSFFENLAIGVLTECYNNDKDLARKILLQKTECFGNTTVLFLAENNYRVDFMSHSCCQSILRILWKGKISLHISTFQIILTMLCPLFLPFIKFVTAERKWGERDDGFTVFEEPKMKSYNVSIFGSSNKQSISFPRAMFYFYSAPITIYWANVISYLVFLGIFSIFLMARFNIDSVSVYEYITYAYVFSLMLEQFRQVLAAKKDHFVYKIKLWSHEEWNTFSLINDVAIIISMILRFSLPKEYFVYARIAFSLTLILHILRFLESLFISEDLGPKVIMIRRMLRDLLSFFLLLIVFMFSFGIAYQANQYPNSPIDFNLLNNIMFHPYFQIYGELFIEKWKEMNLLYVALMKRNGETALSQDVRKRVFLLSFFWEFTCWSPIYF